MNTQTFARLTSSVLVVASVTISAPEVTHATSYKSVPVVSPSTKALLKQTQFGTWFSNNVGAKTISGKKVAGYCLRNVDLIAKRYGYKIKAFPSADKKGRAIRRSGKMNPGGLGEAPLGAIYWWKKDKYMPSGHVAVSDGAGRYINNFGKRLTREVPDISDEQSYLGWSTPNALKI